MSDNGGVVGFVQRLATLVIVVCGSVFVVWHFGSRPHVEQQTTRQLADLRRIHQRAEEMNGYLSHVKQTIDDCKAASDSVARLSARAKEVADATAGAQYAADAANHQANHTGVLVSELHKEFTQRSEIIMRRLDRIERIYEDLLAEVRGNECVDAE
jgi:methyl-accepting chemotaxis protein